MGKALQPRKQQMSQAVPIVGIGASVGGFEAFTTLLKGLPPDTGMAFVLISHLMHEQKSFLGELLSKATSMPVTQLEVCTRIRSNHVYVILLDKELLIEDGYLKTRTLLAAERSLMVID